MIAIKLFAKTGNNPSSTTEFEYKNTKYKNKHKILW